MDVSLYKGFDFFSSNNGFVKFPEIRSTKLSSSTDELRASHDNVSLISYGTVSAFLLFLL